MSETMNAVQFDKNGTATEVCYAGKSPKPKITKDTEVIIRVKAAPVNPSDLGYVKGGGYNLVKSFPAIAGYEGAGTVEEVGAAVKNVSVGQRVHFRVYGASWAEYVRVDTTAGIVVPVPENISFEKAAQFTVNPLTVYGLLDELNVQKGDTLLQTAAASSLGKMLIVIAKNRGIKTINVVRRDDHIEELKKLGADYIINTEKENLVDRVKELTNGEGVKFAVDAVAGPTGTQVAQSLARRGTVLLYGRLSPEPFAVPVLELLSRAAAIRGFFLGDYVATNIEKVRGHYQEIIQLVSADKLPIAFKTFDGLTQHTDAFKHSVAPGKGEKTILTF